MKLGFAPDRIGGTYNALPDSLHGLKGGYFSHSPLLDAFAILILGTSGTLIDSTVLPLLVLQIKHWFVMC